MTIPAERIFKGALIGFALGLAIAVGAASWVWLEMRVNVGLLLPAATALCVMPAIGKERAFPYPLFLIAQIILGVTLLVIYGPDTGALWSIPAYIFREGFHGTGLTLKTAELMVWGILLGGNILWIAFSRERLCPTDDRQR